MDEIEEGKDLISSKYENINDGSFSAGVMFELMHIFK